jgi:hypothetical protein
MGFSSGGSSSSAISTSTDVVLNNVANNEVLTFNTTSGKWQNLMPTTVGDATSSAKGLIQLSGDLAGTATEPTVPGLAVKADTSAVNAGLATKEPTVNAGTTSQYYRGDKTWVTLDKLAVNLNNVDNTADASKPVSTAMQNALNLKADTSTMTTALASKEPLVTAGTTSQYRRGDKTWQTLDKVAVGLSNVDNTSDLAKPISTSTQTALNLKADATSVGTKTLLIANAAALPPGTPAGVIVVVQS